MFRLVSIWFSLSTKKIAIDSMLSTIKEVLCWYLALVSDLWFHSLINSGAREMICSNSSDHYLLVHLLCPYACRYSLTSLYHWFTKLLHGWVATKILWDLKIFRLIYDAYFVFSDVCPYYVYFVLYFCVMNCWWLQFALVSLVKKMALDHPYHTIFQVGIFLLQEDSIFSC